MSLTLSPTVMQLVDAVLELADVYGVFASVYATAGQGRTVCWRNGSFTRRWSSSERLFSVTVITQQGELAQMSTTDWSLAAAERAFHLARERARSDHSRFAQIRRLADLEARCAPFPPAGERQEEWPSSFYRAIEQHHRQCRERFGAIPWLTTSTVRYEFLTAARSDGALYQTAVWRAGCLHEWGRNIGHRLFVETTAETASQLSPESLVYYVDTKLCETDQKPMFAGHLPQSGVIGDSLLLDADITAAIMFAAFLAGTFDHRPPSSASLIVEPSPGLPGYHPLHPYGYPLAPATICSPEKVDQAYLHALRTCADQISSHLTVKLPTLDGQRDQSLHETCQTLADRGLIAELSIFKGIERFHHDPRSGLFILLPKQHCRWSSRRLSIQPPCWLHGSLAHYVAACLGGTGSTVLTWPQAGTGWTMSVPQYALLEMDAVSKEEERHVWCSTFC
ncbi:MAG: hypothetical protein H0Z34_00680 [Brevibacillus sp.]|nr:hypothetical protein [Brevibacillus sp.]